MGFEEVSVVVTSSWNPRLTNVGISSCGGHAICCWTPCSVLYVAVLQIVMLWSNNNPSRPSHYSHGRFPCSTRVGARWGVWCGSIPVSDPWPTGACYQLGKRQAPSGHQGWEVGPHICMGWYFFSKGSTFLCLTVSFLLKVHTAAHRGSPDHRSDWRGQREVLLCGP